MNNLSALRLLFILLFLVSETKTNSQNAKVQNIEFLTAPVLYKEGGNTFQQVVVGCISSQPGNIVFSSGGKELLKSILVKGTNRFREVEGQPGEINISSSVIEKKVKRTIEVNAIGQPIGQPP